MKYLDRRLRKAMRCFRHRSMESTLAGRRVASAFLFADVESEGQRLSVLHWPNPTTARVHDVASLNRKTPPEINNKPDR